MDNHVNEKSRKFADDILDRNQNWMETLSTFRLSNIRVGQNISSLIWGDKRKVLNSDKPISFPSFAKVFCHSYSTYFIISLGRNIQLWKSPNTSENDATMELVFDYPLNGHCIDSCKINSPTDSNLHIALLIKKMEYQSNYQHSVLTMDIKKEKIICEKEFFDDSKGVFATKHHIVVSLPHGVLRLLHPTTLQPIGEISSIPHRPVVFASSARWIAVQGKERGRLCIV
jgi:hypothetical protein